jgi:ribonuclease E
MVLESNRDLVLRRLTECLGRDRTKHQVAEVTSLGLVQMTRKRVGQGLLEVFSEPCDHCRGRGVIVHIDPVDEKRRSGSGSGGATGPAGGHAGGNGRRDRSGSRDAKDDAGKDGTTASTPVEEAADEPAAVAGDGEAAEGSRSSRRNRGRRNRGQSGEDRAAEDAAVLTEVAPDVDGEVAAEEIPALSNDVEIVAVEDTLSENHPPSGDGSSQDDVVEEAGTAPTETRPADDAEPVAAAARPRRRRAASRPAGPPV